MDFLTHIRWKVNTTTKDEEPSSWLSKLKHFLHLEPQNKEELIELLRDAHLRQLIDNETLAMIESAILFAHLRVRDILVPKNQMICIPQESALIDIIQTISDSGHTRFPVIGNEGDNIIGILHAKDLLKYHHQPDSAFNIHDIIRQTTFVPESKRLDILLSEFRNNKNHMAIVVDEYGAISGFITIEDIIEQIIGDIEDEFDIDDESYIKKHSDTFYIVKAITPIDVFNESINANFNDEQYDTIGGIVTTSFGYLPKRGEHITIDHFKFKIISADARRIKLLSCQDERKSHENHNQES